MQSGIKVQGSSYDCVSFPLSDKDIWESDQVGEPLNGFPSTSEPFGNAPSREQLAPVDLEDLEGSLRLLQQASDLRQSAGKSQQHDGLREREQAPVIHTATANARKQAAPTFLQRIDRAIDCQRQQNTVVEQKDTSEMQRFHNEIQLLSFWADDMEKAWKELHSNRVAVPQCREHSPNQEWSSQRRHSISSTASTAPSSLSASPFSHGMGAVRNSYGKPEPRHFDDRQNKPVSSQSYQGQRISGPRQPATEHVNMHNPAGARVHSHGYTKPSPPPSQATTRLAGSAFASAPQNKSEANSKAKTVKPAPKARLAGDLFSSAPVRRPPESAEMTSQTDDRKTASSEQEHAAGQCKPCLFFWYEGKCTKGSNCCFCHMDHEMSSIRRVRPSKKTRERFRKCRDGSEDNQDEQKTNVSGDGSVEL